MSRGKSYCRKCKWMENRHLYDEDPCLDCDADILEEEEKEMFKYFNVKSEDYFYNEDFDY